jgi:hypothetical protein
MSDLTPVAVTPVAGRSRAQLEHAVRLAAASNTDIEEVLLNESGLKVAAIGRALADFFAVPTSRVCRSCASRPCRARTRPKSASRSAA